MKINCKHCGTSNDIKSDGSNHYSLGVDPSGDSYVHCKNCKKNTVFWFYGDYNANCELDNNPDITKITSSPIWENEIFIESMLSRCKPIQLNRIAEFTELQNGRIKLKDKPKINLGELSDHFK